MRHINKSEAGLYFQGLAATLIWGGAYPFTKFLITEISPIAIVGMRGLIGTLFLILWTRSALRPADFSWKTFWKIGILAILGVSSQQYIQAYALNWTAANHAGLLITSAPIMVALVMVVRYKEEMRFIRKIAFAFGFCGALLVIFASRPGGVSTAEATLGIKGDFLFLITCVAWAAYIILSKRWLRDWSQAKKTTLAMLVGTFASAPLLVLSGGISEFTALSSKGWLCLAYLSLVSSAIGYLLWNNAVEGLGPTRAAYFIYLGPFATIFMSFVLLREIPAPAAIAGGLMILSGVFLINSQKPVSIRSSFAGS